MLKKAPTANKTIVQLDQLLSILTSIIELSPYSFSKNL
jgi:hypothetical protein